MGYHVDARQLDIWLDEQKREYDFYAPIQSNGIVQYGLLERAEQIVFDRKPEVSFTDIPEFLTDRPVFAADDVQTQKTPVFLLRSCDIHALKQHEALTPTYIPEEQSEWKLWQHKKIILIGCRKSFENCFCVIDGSNICSNYDMSLDFEQGVYLIDCKSPEWNRSFLNMGCTRYFVVPFQVHENPSSRRKKSRSTAHVPKTRKNSKCSDSNGEACISKESVTRRKK